MYLKNKYGLERKTVMKIEDYKKALIEAEEKAFRTNSLLEVKESLEKNGIKAPQKTIYIFAQDVLKRT